MVGVGVYFLMHLLGRDDASGWFIAALLIPVPVDFAICIIAFAVVQYGVDYNTVFAFITTSDVTGLSTALA